MMTVCFINIHRMDDVNTNSYYVRDYNVNILLLYRAYRVQVM
jgi:hypothetical protein